MSSPSSATKPSRSPARRRSVRRWGDVAVRTEVKAREDMDVSLHPPSPHRPSPRRGCGSASSRSTATTSTGSKDGRTKADATRSSGAAPTARSPTSRPAITTSARACTSTAAAPTSSRMASSITRISSTSESIGSPGPAERRRHVTRTRRNQSPRKANGFTPMPRSTNAGSGSSAFARITRERGTSP